MAAKRISGKNDLKRKSRRRAEPLARAKRAGGGNPSYGGYEYQIGVTVWLALDLMLAKEAADFMLIEPPSHEDIEASVRDPDKASLDLTSGGRFELVVQAKSRSTGPWSTTAFADVLKGKPDQGGVPSANARTQPLAMLEENPQRRYVFVTNESVNTGLQPHCGEHLLDFDDVSELPPHAREGFNAGRVSSEDLIRGELDTILARPRYERRKKASDEGSADVTGHRHGSRTRSLTGTFGPIEIAVPRARSEYEERVRPAARARTSVSIGSSQLSKRSTAISAVGCKESAFMVLLMMAWSPVRRSNAG